MKRKLRLESPPGGSKKRKNAAESFNTEQQEPYEDRGKHGAGRDPMKQVKEHIDTVPKLKPILEKKRVLMQVKAIDKNSNMKSKKPAAEKPSEEITEKSPEKRKKKRNKKTKIRERGRSCISLCDSCLKLMTRDLHRNPGVVQYDKSVKKENQKMVSQNPAKKRKTMEHNITLGENSNVTIIYKNKERSRSSSLIQSEKNDVTNKTGIRSSNQLSKSSLAVASDNSSLDNADPDTDMSAYSSYHSFVSTIQQQPMEK